MAYLETWSIGQRFVAVLLCSLPILGIFGLFQLFLSSRNEERNRKWNTRYELKGFDVDGNPIYFEVKR